MRASDAPLTGVRLWSWLDVEAVLRASSHIDAWRESIVEAYAYPTSVELTVRNESRAHQLLGEIFGPRYVAESGITLQSGGGEARVLPVHMEISAEQAQQLDLFQPQFREVRFADIADLRFRARKRPAYDVPLYAFYSFKGGVGRTTLLVATLLAYSRRFTKPALIVDADLEAPGISWLAETDRFDTSLFSCADLLALLISEQRATEIAAAEILRNPIDISTASTSRSHYLLPAFRTDQQALGPFITPLELLRSQENQWLLSDSLVDLGRRLNVGAIFVDLRAGFSEMASPLLFDAGVTRYIVTTTGIQSSRGTEAVASQLQKLIEPTSRAAAPYIVLSQLLTETKESEAYPDLLSNLRSAIIPKDTTETPEDIESDYVLETDFAQPLMHARSLSALLRELEGTNLPDVMGSTLVEPAISYLDGAGVRSRDTDLDSKRRRLGEFAAGYEFAEAGRNSSFLATPQLRSLARRFSDNAPLVPIIGQKGAGKTFTFLQIVRNGVWARFVREVLGGASSGLTWLVYPITSPGTLGEAAKLLVNAARDAIANTAAGSFLPSNIEIREHIERVVDDVDDTRPWRLKWFDIFARSLGLAVSRDMPDRDLLQILATKGTPCILLLDGLEELFRDIRSNERQQFALRSLLVDVLPFLEEWPAPTLGLIPFVRQDYLRTALKQNSLQFEKRYENFILRWNDEQALRLALWCMREATGVGETGEILEMPVSDLSASLEPLWGRKMGTAASRRAISQSWVTAILSDYRGRIQARDLVRLLKYAAEGSQGSRFSDRLLSPEALQAAVLPCSEGKLRELSEESPDLGEILNELQARNTELAIPLAEAELDVTADRLQALKDAGILLEYDEMLYMPEIFRLGLHLELKPRYRARILTLAKRAASMRAFAG